MATFRFYVTQTNDLQIDITADSLEDAQAIFDEDVIAADMDCVSSEWQDLGVAHEVTV
jgi:hypothetical protein